MKDSKTRITRPLPFASPPSPEEIARFTKSFVRLTGREPRDYEINLHALLWRTNVGRRRKLASGDLRTD